MAFQDEDGRQHAVPLAQVRRALDETGAAVYQFNVPGPDGKARRVTRPEGGQPLFKIDPATGMRFVEAKDGVTGAMKSQEAGYDPVGQMRAGAERNRQRLAKQERLREAEVEALAGERRSHVTALQKSEAALRPAQQAYDAIAREPVRYARTPHGLARIIGDETGGVKEMTLMRAEDAAAQAEARQWLARRDRARQQLATAQEAHAALTRHAAELDEQEAALARRLVDENRQAEFEKGQAAGVIQHHEQAANDGKAYEPPLFDRSTADQALTGRLETRGSGMLEPVRHELEKDAKEERDRKLKHWETGGYAAAADAARKLQEQHAAQLREIDRQHPQEGPERDRALQALEDGMKAWREGVARMPQQIHDAAKDLWEKWGAQQPIDWTNPEEVEPVAGQLVEEARRRGLSAADARQWMATLALSDWERPHGALWPEEEDYRVLPNGNVTVNPAHILDREAYEAAVKASGVSPEARRAALENRRLIAPELAANALRVLRQNGAMAEWLEENTHGTDLERMEQFTALMKEGGWLNGGLMNFMAAAAGIGASTAGALSAVTGNDSFTQADVPSLLSADWWAKRKDAYSMAGGTALKDSGAWGKWGAMAIGAAPDILEGMAAGGAAGRAYKVLRGVQATAKGAQIAGVAGAAMDAGIQSLGSTYVEAYQRYLNEEMASLTTAAEVELGRGPSAEQVEEAKARARSRALLPAVADAMVSAGLTALGGARGVEGIFRAKDMIKAEAKKSARAFARQLGIDAGEEALEGFAEQFMHGVIHQATYDKELTVEQIFQQSVDAALVGAFFGGTIGGAQRGVDTDHKDPHAPPGTAAGAGNSRPDPNINPKSTSGPVVEPATEGSSTARIPPGTDNPSSQNKAHAEDAQKIAADIDSFRDDWTPTYPSASADPAQYADTKEPSPRSGQSRASSGSGELDYLTKYYEKVGRQKDNLDAIIAHLEKQGIKVEEGDGATYEPIEGPDGKIIGHKITHGPHTKKWEILEEYAHARVEIGWKAKEIAELKSKLQKGFRKPFGGWWKMKNSEAAIVAEEIIVKQHLLDHASSLGEPERERLRETIKQLYNRGLQDGY